MKFNPWPEGCCWKGFALDRVQAVAMIVCGVLELFCLETLAGWIAEVAYDWRWKHSYAEAYADDKAVYCAACGRIIAWEPGEPVLCGHCWTEHPELAKESTRG